MHKQSNTAHSESTAILSGCTIIYFGPEKWEGMWRNRHQLMSRLAKRNKVMYVEPASSIHRIRKQCNKGWQGCSCLWHDFFEARVSTVQENLYIYHSPVLVPIIGRFPFDKISWYIWDFFFKSTLNALGFTNPIIFFSRPRMACYLKKYNEILSCYHVVDEYLSYGNIDIVQRENLEKNEQQLATSVDVVIVVSDALYQSKQKFNGNTYLVPNGVDYAAYTKVLESDTPPPLDIAELPRPIIGYSGLISRRLDLALIKYIAQTRSDWTLVLIGAANSDGCEEELSELGKLQNVHLLGSKKIDLVPHYIKAFDLCMIPYKLNEQTRNLSPLKLYDFLAMGKEIVATDFPVARDFKDVVSIAETPNAFVQSIAHALQMDGTGLFEKRRQIAAQNTWDHRVEEISAKLAIHLKK